MNIRLPEFLYKMLPRSCRKPLILGIPLKRYMELKIVGVFVRMEYLFFSPVIQRTHQTVKIHLHSTKSTHQAPTSPGEQPQSDETLRLRNNFLRNAIIQKWNLKMQFILLY